MTTKYILQDRIPTPASDLLTWAQWMERGDRLVGFDVVGEAYQVSTVFLGLNFNLFDDGPPHFFETMVFTLPTSMPSMAKYTRRYSTWEQAERGHQQIVDRVRRDLDAAIADALNPKESQP